MPLTLSARQSPLASTTEQLRILETTSSCPAFEVPMERAGLHPLRSTGITVFQVNVGKLCNQICRHCHVDAGPDRTERMSRETAELCMQALAQTDIPTVDITGGAPELNPHFRWLVEQARGLKRHVMDRCNLSVLLLPSQADLAGFLATHRVEIIASLPYYKGPQTDAQRGEGVFDKSMEGLRRLNQLGYGAPDSGLVLNLVQNPAGVMCRYTLSVSWDGTLYDCDFNQMLDRPVGAGAPRHIRDFNPAQLQQRIIVTGNHCYGCTAGSGSSCGGAVTA